MFAGAAIGAACGGDDGDSNDQPDAGGGGGGCTETISGNHGHTLTVSAADVAAAADKTYDITGGAGHSHSVMITAAQFGMLASGMTVSVTSTSGGGHTHNVTVSDCA